MRFREVDEVGTQDEPKFVFIFRGGVTLCAGCARARPVFGSDKSKDLCGHAQFLLRNVPEYSGARPLSKT